MLQSLYLIDLLNWYLSLVCEARRKVYSHDSTYRRSLFQKHLVVIMTPTFCLVVCHVFSILEDRLSDKVEALVFHVPISWSSLHGENVWFPILSAVNNLKDQVEIGSRTFC
jgi:hypothetical protein